MVQFRWIGGSCLRNINLRIAEEYFMTKMAFYSLFHNSLTTWSTIMDAGLEPMFWFVDHFIRYLGPAFVVLVIILTTSVVVIFYICLLPHKMAESTFWTMYHLICGHWCLINIVFHYFKAAFTNPGHPPQQIPEVVAVCKKCITPKPPRTHHCSVCKKCVLRMDHHCPWLNNCVGHFNHRHFFMFCVYMWVGTIYVSISAYPLFKEHFYGTEADSIGWSGFFYPYHIAVRGVNGGKIQTDFGKEEDGPPIGEGIDAIIPKSEPSVPSPTRDTSGIYFHNFIIYEFMLCTAVSLALGVLVFWHARLISQAETSIEVHVNRSEKDRQSKLGHNYRNPYDFGVIKNWKNFLGLTQGRTFCRHILLPSSHKPDEDGLTWRTRSSKSHRGILLL